MVDALKKKHLQNQRDSLKEPMEAKGKKKDSAAEKTEPSNAENPTEEDAEPGEGHDEEGAAEDCGEEEEPVSDAFEDENDVD